MQYDVHFDVFLYTLTNFFLAAKAPAMCGLRTRQSADPDPQDFLRTRTDAGPVL